MSDAVGGALNKKVGGIPAKWLILLGVVVALGVYLWQRYRGTGGTDSPVPVTISDDELVDTTFNDSGDLPSEGGDSFGGSYTSATPTISTNDQWARNAANGLIGQGTYQATDVTNALSNYITGTALTAQQNAIVNAALAGYGQPPENIVATANTPVVTKATLTGDKHLYKTKSGDTLGSVIQKTYGKINATLQAAVVAANPGLKSTKGARATKLSTALAAGKNMYLPVYTEGVLP